MYRSAIFLREMAFFVYMDGWMVMYVILASNSPRRRELLLRICPDFTVLPADADETVEEGTSPEETVKILARRKAECVFKKALETGMVPAGERLVVIGSDTVVALDGKVLGKPKDAEDAKRMLRLLSGRTHAVYTGVCLRTVRGARVEAERSDVTFRRLSKEQIEAYVATGSPMDKAGAYGIQDGAVVAGYTGSYTNIVGLPCERTEKMLKEIRQEEMQNAENSH